MDNELRKGGGSGLDASVEVDEAGGILGRDDGRHHARTGDNDHRPLKVVHAALHA